MSPHIIVGYDGTDGGADALALALALRDGAPDRGLEMTVATVYPGDLRRFTGRPIDGEYERALAEDAGERLSHARATCGDRAGVSFVARAGMSPAQALQLMAEELGAEAIVVGRSHTGALERTFVGSVTEQTLHGAPCAVAVAPLGYASGTHEIGTIGVAFDGSPESQRAAEVAAEVARGAGAELRLIRALQPLPQAYGGFPDPYSLADRRADARAQLDDARERLDAGPVETQIVVGDPVDALSEPSRAVDLLVLGSRGFGPVQRVLLGSVSSRLVRECPVPLMIVPRSARPADGGRPPR